jgi:oxygen-dependent protoporphyrinogen oxidase
MVVGLSLRHVLREFGLSRSLLLPLLRRGGRIDPPDACSFREGMQVLPAALASRHRERIRYGSAVREVRRTGHGFTVITDGEAIEAEQVVLTAPAPETAAQLAGLAPAAAERLRRLNYNPLAVVHLLATRGVTWNDSLFGRTGVYTAYLGGARRAEVVARSDTSLGELAVAEFRLATGYDAHTLSVERERMPAWDRSWAALSGLELPAGMHICANWESRPGIPGRLLQAKRLAAKLAPAG